MSTLDAGSLLCGGRAGEGCSVAIPLIVVEGLESPKVVVGKQEDLVWRHVRQVRWSKADNLEEGNLRKVV